MPNRTGGGGRYKNSLVGDESTLSEVGSGYPYLPRQDGIGS